MLVVEKRGKNTCCSGGEGKECILQWRRGEGIHPVVGRRGIHAVVEERGRNTCYRGGGIYSVVGRGGTHSVVEERRRNTCCSGECISCLDAPCFYGYRILACKCTHYHSNSQHTTVAKQLKSCTS